jgi:endonuclease YncB( thermonuclease family)
MLHRLALLIALTLATAAHSETITGQAVTHDGDTLTLGSVKIRLAAVDAPELSQSCSTSTGAAWPCGIAARDGLVALIGGGLVTCQLEPKPDRYGRRVGTCSTLSHGNLNRAMVWSGLAVPYLEYGGERYAADEAKARAAHRGIWSGSFVTPAEYRAAKRHRR